MKKLILSLGMVFFSSYLFAAPQCWKENKANIVDGNFLISLGANNSITDDLVREIGLELEIENVIGDFVVVANATTLAGESRFQMKKRVSSFLRNLEFKYPSMAIDCNRWNFAVFN
jgi:hypothetical protein